MNKYYATIGVVFEANSLDEAYDIALRRLVCSDITNPSKDVDIVFEGSVEKVEDDE